MITPKQLEKIKNESIEELFKFKIWSSEIYSFGKILRKYAFFPKFLPLLISTDHGPSQSDEPNKSELNYNGFAHFYHSQRLVDKFKLVSTKRCYNLTSPFVWYRKHKGIKQIPNANGTIVFPTHSTHFISVEQDWIDYIKKLKELPAKYQPVSACLYFMDVQKDLHKIFEENGIETFCAGTWLDDKFVDNFYDIIKNFRYASSPSPGSHLFYCVELGLKFFIYGNEPEYLNFLDENSPVGKYNLKNNIQIEKVKNKYFIENIDREYDKNLIEEELGLTNNSISRFRFSLIVYLALINLVYRKVYWKIKNCLLKETYVN